MTHRLNEWITRAVLALAIAGTYLVAFPVHAHKGCDEHRPTTHHGCPHDKGGK